MHSLELDKLTEFLKGVGLSNVEHITQDELFFGNNLKRRLVECDLPFMQNLPLDENNQISQKDLEKFIEKSYVNVDALIKSIENVDSATAVFALTSANLDSVVLNGVLEKYKDINTDEVDLIAKVNGLEELATVFRKWIDAKSSDSDLQVFNFVQSYLGRGEVEKNSIEAARDLRADLIAHRYAYNKLLIPSKFKYYTKARLGLFLIELLKTDDAAAPVDPTNSIPIPLDTALLAQFAKDVNVGINIKGTLLDFEEKNRKLFASILINLQSTFLNNPITSEDITTYLDRSFSDVDANDPLFGYDHLDNNDNFNSKIEKIQSSDYKPFTTNASTKMMMRNVFDILFGQRTDFLAATLSDKSFHRLMYEAGKLRKDLDKDERRKGTLVTNFMSLMAHANYDQRQPCNKQGYIDDINVALHTAPELNDVEFACSAKTTKTSGGGIPDKSKYEYQTVVSSLENAKVKINDAKLNVNDIMASYKAIANQIKIEDASASISNQEGLQAAYDEYISSIQPLFQKTKESLSIVANALKLALETDESDQIDRLTNSLYAITEVKDLKRSADAITHICDKFEKTMNNIFSLTNGNRSASSASSANATTPPVIWFSPPTPAQTPPAAAGRSVQIFGRPSAEHESIIEKITKINPLIDNLLSHYKEYVAAFNTPSGIPGEPMPTLISDVYNNYIERSKVDKSEALDNLYLDVKRNNLDIKRVLALTMMDRVAMIFITLFLRIIAVSITEWTISRGYVTTITSSLTVYLVCYTALFIIFAIFVNLDQYRLRIIFNYVNFNRNTPLIFIHIASLWSLAFLIYKLLTSVNMPLSFWDTSAMSDEEQYRLMYRIEMLSFLVWTIMACMIGFM